MNIREGSTGLHASYITRNHNKSHMLIEILVIQRIGLLVLQCLYYIIEIIQTKSKEKFQENVSYCSTYVKH